MIEILQALKPVFDLGLTAILVLGGLYIVIHPPRWIQIAVDSHHQLAEGVRTLSETVAKMPQREEFQELLIGQEALRRETVQVHHELRELRQSLPCGAERAGGGGPDGRCG